MRDLTYFVSDVHLGLDVKNPAARESRFASFLNSVPKERTEALYMLGDIWDFWYEYHDVVPKGYVRVFAALMDLIDAGVKVYFFQGNHDIWCYHYFQDMGIRILKQPYVVQIAGKTFCMGHGDGLGPGHIFYKMMRWGFRNRFLQGAFSLLHPYLAFRFGKGWSKKSRVAKMYDYIFKGKDEPLYKFAEDFQKGRKIDYFVFGHFHCDVRMKTDSGAELIVLKDWMDGAHYMYFDGSSIRFGYSPNIEK
ncbi:MAG: UDP-2,3-diacylglucosamine diphosphatase [Candidatus Cryptobacteroides sp.]